MEKLLEKNNLRKTFSKAAATYDSASHLQKRICEELFNHIILDNLKPKLILDIGMGTGYLMQNLTGHYPNSKVVGIDFAFGMNKTAKENNLVVFQADCQYLPFKNQDFDLVVSNLVFQWVKDLDYCFREVNRILKEKGSFYFTLFSGKTLKELRQSFSDIKNFYFSPPAAEEIELSLEKNNFRNIKIETSASKENFKDLFALVSWLKSVGANRLSRTQFMGKEIWRKANEIYSGNFRDNGSIYATFEVIEVKAQKGK
jgi:malonyl-CoA O-methyltransferase